MIRATELRIGNYVNAFKTTYIIDSNDFQYVDSDTYLMPYDPIPLTEDILLKCGKKELDLFIIGDYYYSKGSLLMSSYNDGEPDIFLAKVDTLHHLQNIIFALTGEELKVEL